MTLPLSGPLDASDINVELGRSATATFSITDAATGVYGAINTCSPYYPNASAPHAYSEWYGYNHLAPCIFSYYAFSDGGLATAQNMLYNNTLNYGTRVSTSSPNTTSTFTYSFWMKRATDDSDQGYIHGLSSPTTNARIAIYWSSLQDPNNPGLYWNTITFSYQNPTGSGYAIGTVNISESNGNSSTSGVSDSFWGTTNQGNVDTNGYSLITIVYDYSAFNTDNFIKFYWNGTQLTAPWGVPAAGKSKVYGDSIASPSWTNANMYIGGFVPSELSSGCQLDGFALYTQTAIAAGDVSNIYNGGAVASLTTYRNISTNLLFYNFESDTPNIGTETGGTYGMTLDEFNSPLRVADPAL